MLILRARTLDLKETAPLTEERKNNSRRITPLRKCEI